MPLTVELITVERVVRVDSGVDVLIVPGAVGRLAIYPKHAALMTTLEAGELIMRRAGEEDSFFVTGGFLEVRANHITVLADASEAAEEIDIGRAEEARRRAEERIRRFREQAASDADLAMAQASLQRALLRLRVAEQRRRRTTGRPQV
jgi:F-type H+-transporting ATPase subunit epsilon